MVCLGGLLFHDPIFVYIFIYIYICVCVCACIMCIFHGLVISNSQKQIKPVIVLGQI